MNSALEKLLFRVQLVDQVSKPMAHVTKQIESMKNTADKGFGMIRNGAMGAAATGAAMYGIVNPIRQVNKALGGVSSLEVVTKELDRLEKSAFNFQNSYGDSAAEFIRSSYDIQSAISGLVDGELATFTYSSNLLAKGTKSDAATITDYMGTMYNIFSDQAEKMGKAEWVKQLTGQTAEAVKMFKTTGSEMASSFSSLGASAQTMGVSMQEQIAILGHLQSTMSGSEAATKYKAFLDSAGQAQKQLGINMTDTTGKLLPMNKILAQLHKQFGDTFTVAEGDTLKKAFGSDEAVALVKNLIKSSGQLEKSINKISKIKGLGPAEKMAAEVTDEFDRLWGSVKTSVTVFGKQLLPILRPVVDWLGRVSGGVQTWLEKNPQLAKALGLGTFAVLTLSFAFSALTAALGVGYVAVAAWKGMAVVWALFASGAAKTIILTKAIWLLNGALAVLTSPLLLIPAAIAAVVAAAWYLYKNWNLAVSGMQVIFDWFGKMFDHAVLWAQKGYNAIATIMDKLAIEALTLKLTFDDSASKDIDKVYDRMRARNMDLKIYEKSLAKKDDRAIVRKVDPLKKLDVPAGGLKQSISNSSSSTSNTYQIGSINTSATVDMSGLEDVMELEG